MQYSMICRYFCLIWLDYDYDFLDKTLGIFGSNRSNHERSNHNHKRRPRDHVHSLGISVINNQKGKRNSFLYFCLTSLRCVNQT